MRYNRLGKTELWVSAVGFGTCQLRLVPEQQAIDTLKRGFELGVNWVHTAPDYEGADDLVAQAIEESQRPVFVLSQGYGDRPHFEYLFEETCRKFQKSRLEIFGIACIDDREYLKEPVWKPGGIIDFLLAKKQEGRLGGIFCTTHGTPEYLLKLIHSGVFDALMLAYNPLGFHLLSYHPGDNKPFESIPETRSRVFPIAVQQQVSLLIMKPLAGGLLLPGKAFPPRQRFSTETVELKAGNILRFILSQPGVCSVVPGTASVDEAEENALAGYDLPPTDLSPKDLAAKDLASQMKFVALEPSLKAMQTSLCSRCGYCDDLCSQSLPISWIFRDAYIHHYPSETFETVDDCQYFHLHPKTTATCSGCEQQTCQCPYGIDIPASLIHIHDRMMALQTQGLLPKTPQQLRDTLIDGPLRVQVVSQQIPKCIQTGQPAICRFYLHNAGDRTWTTHNSKIHGPTIVLGVMVSGRVEQYVSLRHDVPPGTRTHITFELHINRKSGVYPVQFLLTSTPQSQAKFADDATEIAAESIQIIANSSVDPGSDSLSKLAVHKPAAIPRMLAALASRFKTHP